MKWIDMNVAAEIARLIDWFPRAPVHASASVATQILFLKLLNGNDQVDALCEYRWRMLEEWKITDMHFHDVVVLGIEEFLAGVDIDSADGQMILRNRTGIDRRFGSVCRPPMASGEAAFVKHDTHGYPIEFFVKDAARRGLCVDMRAFEAKMEEQRARSRAGSKFSKAGCK